MDERLAAFTKEDRIIHTGCTWIELSDDELRLGAVSYLYRPHPGANMERRFAAPEEVLQSRIPDVMFQVSEDGYENMKDKSNRLLALRRGERL